MTQGPYRLSVTASAMRALTEPPPTGVGERVAWAVHDFINGPLLENPQRVGKPLRPPMEGTHSARRGTFRVLYEIDDQRSVVTVTGVKSRADSYRPR